MIVPAAAGVLGLVLLVVAQMGIFTRAQRGITPQIREYATSTGQQLQLTLSDGTRVTLAPQSTLRIATAPTTPSRTVAIVGEAYFDVRTVPGAPFIVRTGNVATRVLGTTFSVRRYPGDAHVQVAVTSGKVAVSGIAGPRSALTLAAGGVGFVTDSTAIQISADSARQYTAWTTGKLVFHEVPARDVLATLTHWYGYQFALTDSALASYRLTTILDAQSSANALGTIKLLLNVDLTFDGDVVTLHPRQARHAPSRDMHRLRHPLTTPNAEVGR